MHPHESAHIFHRHTGFYPETLAGSCIRFRHIPQQVLQIKQPDHQAFLQFTAV